MLPVSMMPLPMVAATAVPRRKGPMKLKMAARMRAWPGVRTLVATTVAMALAASWKPLTKSKMRATTMAAAMKGWAAMKPVMASRMRHHLTGA